MYTTNGQPDEQLRSSMFSLSGTEFFGAIGRSINLGMHSSDAFVVFMMGMHNEVNDILSLNEGGQAALALRLLLAVFSSKISINIDRPFGNEVVTKFYSD